MTDHVPDTHQSVTAAELLDLKSNLGLGPLPEWAPDLEFSERAIDRFVYSQEPAGEMAEEFRADLAAVIAEAVTAERDCRTCKNWTPHHRSDVMHCSAALRCVAGSSYRRQGVVRLWEADPVDAGF